MRWNLLVSLLSSRLLSAAVGTNGIDYFNSGVFFILSVVFRPSTTVFRILMLSITTQGRFEDQEGERKESQGLKKT